MGQNAPLRTAHRASPARVAGVYLLFGLLWVWLSDRVLLALEPGAGDVFWAAALKGTAFIALSAGLMYWLVRREVRTLARALDLLRAVADGTTDAVFVKDRTGKYLLINRAGAECFGRPVAEVVGRDDFELLDRPSAELLRARDALVMQARRPHTAEEEVTAAGVTRTYLANKAPYRDAGGAVCGVVGVSRDVTARKRAEEALRAGQQRYEQLVASVGGIVWEVDPQTFRFTFVSEWAERLLGYPVAQWSEPDFWVRHLHPDDRDWATAFCLVATREHRSHDFEYRILAADGRVVWVRDLVTVVVEGGVVASLRGVMVDVTAQKRAEAFLARQNRALERIATASPLADVLAEVTALVEHELTGTLASVLLLDRDGTRLRHGAAPRLPPEYCAAIDGVVIGPAVGSCGTAAFTREPALVADIATDPRWADYKELALAHGLRACWSVPILGTQRGTAARPVLGTFAVYAREPGVSPARLAEVVARAEQLARVAIESDRADRELRESEGRYRALVESSSDGIAVSRAGRITFANAALARMLGAGSPERLVGLAPSDLIHPGHHAAFRAALDELAAGRPVPLSERRFVRFDGGVVDTEVSAVACEDRGAPAVQVTVRDVTDRVRAAQALREQAVFIQAVLDSMTAYIAVLDRSGTIVAVNAAWRAMAEGNRLPDGRVPDAGVGTNYLDVCGRSAPACPDAAAAAAAIRQVFEGTADRVSFGYACHSPTERRWFQMNVTPLRRGRGEVVVAHTNITDQRLVEESLLESEERYRETVEAAPDAIVTTDRRGTILGWNRGAERLFGWTAREAVGRDVGLVVPARHAGEHRNALAAFDPAAPSRVRGRVIEAPGARKDGAEVPVEIALAHWGDGADRRFTAIIRDVTARHRAEQELREREGQLRLFVDHGWAAVALVDRDMRYVRTSRRWLTDYNLGDRDLTGLSHYDLFPDTPERLREVHRRCLAGGEGRCDEDRFDRADGTAQWVRWEVRPWRRADGAVAGLVMYTEDVTARKRMEAHYQQALKMEAVGRLAGGIAHDFNNLLTVINGFSDLLLRDVPADDPRRGPLGEIGAAGERAARLTQQLLAYSRKAMIEPTVFDLSELVAETAKLIRLVGEDVLVTQLLDPEPARVRADRGQLEQVLLNLVVNARDAMPTGGRLTIETRAVALGPDELPDDPDLRPGRYVRLTVADTGCGMSDAVQARLFEPFFTTKGVGKGTGLGLAVVHGAVKQNGGHISVTSAAGAGSTFTLLFPAAVGPAGAAAEAPVLPARGAETVLLVEDEDAVRAVTRRALEGCGYTVLAAGGAEAALALSDQHPGGIDLLVTDVVMPHTGGRELADALRDRRPGLRVLFISGYTNEVVLRHGLSDAADAFLQKPYTPAVLARKVREMMDRAE
ncbi:PAS domain S-box protein [Gemmata sp. JC673]|uniref:histidine kinase n=1 Tax=Gemmata algarum TaxID=2975278 RepID=A0ABU5F4F5_9BACT|nr:PAS domain S-box protein [Gemmata algarum]MDY3562432.1 PAS domain S-box protein [Gemmata algarum]